MSEHTSGSEAPPPPPGYYQQPAAPLPMYESEARTISMWIHYGAAIAAILSASMASFLVPLVMWLIYRQRSALVDWHGKQNLNLQLSVIVSVIAGVIIGVVTIGFGFIVTIPAMVVYWIYSIVISFIAGAAAQRGEYYPIKLAIPFVR